MMSDEVIQLMHEANRLRFERPLEAHRLYTDAIERCRHGGLRRELIQALKGLGQIDRDLNNGNEALRLYEEAVTICREGGEALMLAHTVRHVGDIHQDAGRNKLAEPCYHEALSIYRRHAETLPLDLANTIRPLAILKEIAGEFEEASRLWAEARDLYAAENVTQGVAESSRWLARLQFS
jgi:tetratricopeptide (TPR) repeat protein